MKLIAFVLSLALLGYALPVGAASNKCKQPDGSILTVPSYAKCEPSFFKKDDEWSLTSDAAKAKQEADSAAIVNHTFEELAQELHDQVAADDGKEWGVTKSGMRVQMKYLYTNGRMLMGPMPIMSCIAQMNSLEQMNNYSKVTGTARNLQTGLSRAKDVVECRDH